MMLYTTAPWRYELLERRIFNFRIRTPNNYCVRLWCGARKRGWCYQARNNFLYTVAMFGENPRILWASLRGYWADNNSEIESDDEPYMLKKSFTFERKVFKERLIFRKFQIRQSIYTQRIHRISASCLVHFWYYLFS